jgi:hypothetical protein
MRRFLAAAAAFWLIAALSAASSAQSGPHTRPLSPKAAALFKTSDECVACHNGLRSGDNEDVSIGTMWRSTIMANSARDPYFHAGLRREVMDHPSQAAEIQHECAGCHAPMLQRAAHTDGRMADVLSQLPIRGDNPLPEHRLAADGVSCAVCHQISAERLGTRESFNGQFGMAAIGPEPRQAFGPYAVNAGRARIMRSVTGFVQTEAPHIRESALCATCHTLYTKAHDAGGRIVGEFPEQMNFQEWQHSAFYGEQRSCQSCHMPDVPGLARIASVLGEPREGLSRHLFVGGNFLVLRMLDRHRTDLGVEAPSSALEATASATIRQLQTDTATVTLLSERRRDAVVADVTVRNLTGHKFPTGYPSRRTWLHLTARDERGRVVFESGALGADGAIVGNDNDRDAATYEPHYDELRRPDQVQIYETIIGDQDNAVTTGLLRAARYLKDNRLLPRGFDKATAHADVAVHGDARTDRTFTDDGDRVRYLLPTAAADIQVELWYQPIAFRWAQNLRSYDAPEPRRFVDYFTAMADDSSVVVARATGRVSNPAGADR